MKKVRLNEEIKKLAELAKLIKEDYNMPSAGTSNPESHIEQTPERAFNIDDVVYVNTIFFNNKKGKILKKGVHGDAYVVEYEDGAKSVVFPQDISRAPRI